MPKFIQFRKAEIASSADKDIDVWINPERIRSIEPDDADGLTAIYFNDDERIVVRGEANDLVPRVNEILNP